MSVLIPERKNTQKHPRGLWILSFGELCDRFSYYGIVTVMTLYLAKFFLFNDHLIYGISGVYSTLGFGLPVLGGLIADRVLGYRHAVILGALLIILGNLILCLSGLWPIYLGLSLLVTGIGLFKANITSQVGTLYAHGDERKEGAFASFYFGMNIGAFTGPLVFGGAVFLWGWHAGFAFGAVSMALSLLWYLSAYSYFGDYLLRFNADIKALGGSPELARLPVRLVCLVLIFLSLIVFYWMFSHSQYFSDFVWIFALLMLLAVGVIAYQRKETQERKHILVFMIFVAFSIFYFACARQVNTSIELFLDRSVDRHIFGYKVPIEWFASFEPIFIAVTLIIISPAWRYVTKIGKQPSPMILVVLGLFFASLSFIIFALAARASEASSLVGLNWPLYLLLLGYFILGVGELAIFPSITSMVTDLAPKGLQATFMGFWLLSSAFSSYVGAIMANLSAISPELLKTLSSAAVAQIYQNAFFEIASIVFIIMLVALLGLPWIRRLVKLS